MTERHTACGHNIANTTHTLPALEYLGCLTLQGTEYLLTYHSNATTAHTSSTVHITLTNLSLQQTWHKTAATYGPLNLGVTQDIYDHLMTFIEMKRARGFDCNPSSPFFTTNTGAPLSNSIASKCVRREMKAAGIRIRTTANTFRHSITTMILTRVMVYIS